MTETIELVYQNGIFKPLNAVPESVTEGSKIKLVIEVEESSSIMKLAENFYEGLSEDEIDEIEKIALDRSNFFGDRKA